MNNAILIDSLFKPIIPIIVKPHQVTLSDAINPDIMFLCGAYSMYDVWF